MSNILSKLTTNAELVLQNAKRIALMSRKKESEPEDLLLALFLQKGSLAAEILNKARLIPPSEPRRNRDGISSPNILREQRKRIINPKEELKPSREKDENLRMDLPFSLEIKKIIERAYLAASQYHHQYVGTEHLLYALIKNLNPDSQNILKQQKINLKKLTQTLSTVLKSTSRFPELLAIFSHTKTKREEKIKKREFKKTPALDFFGQDLTNKKFQKGIDPVIGREKEISRLITILCRRDKNNPILLGDPGVGKTAIVEGLAKKIIQEEVPDVLINKKIYSLDLSLVVAGTIFRGEFESRLKEIIEEIKDNPEIILFIDEIHNIIGAGSASGSLDAANILKPALSRGEIRCIGATTMEEFKKHIEPDPALERRFQPILIRESTPAETLEILRGIKENYEKYHRVKITEEAIRSATYLSERFIPEKFLPDKAIDLLDEAASLLKIKKGSSSFVRKIKAKEKTLEEIKEAKEEALRKEKYEEALTLKRKEENLRAQLEELYQKAEKENKTYLGEIKQKDVERVIAGITELPFLGGGETLLLMDKRVTSTPQGLEEDEVLDKRKLLKLDKILAQKIIGQEKVLKDLASFIRRSQVGLSHPERPLASFIFLGPSGVGKTELARVLAQTLFGSEDSLIRIDMAEFAESFNLSKLIGAPPGYVGYREETKLTDAVKKKPYSIILLDEIEKAHREVFNILLPILETGSLRDATGRKINFKNTIIIMTSNLGVTLLNKSASLGFEVKSKKETKKIREKFKEIREKILKDLKNRFQPEFLNRIDKILVFEPLNLDKIKKIVTWQVEEINERLKERALKIKISPEALKLIAKISFSPEGGAREVRHSLEEVIENPLAEAILTGQFKKGDTVRVRVKGKKVVLEK